MPDPPNSETHATDHGLRPVDDDTTRRAALVALFLGLSAIGSGYAAAFSRGGTPAWAAWLLALGIPVALGAIMVLGAARGRSGIGPLKFPFVFVIAVLVIGFGAALALPATEGPLSTLWLGLPMRAAIVIYGVGLLPVIVLPVAYALTFETQTLNAEDVERVRALARLNSEIPGPTPRAASVKIGPVTDADEPIA